MTISRNLSDILMQETIKLYNNVAESSECKGRLKADLVVFPSPRIEWDYESLGEIRGKPWPLVANSLGALLERLAVAILVKELNIRGLGNRQRLKRLLEEIGIPQDTGHIDTFVDLRNWATHPTGNSPPTSRTINLILHRAKQWAEECILWRLGYSGKYPDRRDPDRYAVTEPRYNLTRRKPEW